MIDSSVCALTSRLRPEHAGGHWSACKALTGCFGGILAFVPTVSNWPMSEPGAMPASRPSIFAPTAHPAPDQQAPLGDLPWGQRPLPRRPRSRAVDPTLPLDSGGKRSVGNRDPSFEPVSPMSRDVSFTYVSGRSFCAPSAAANACTTRFLSSGDPRCAKSASRSSSSLSLLPSM